MSLQQVDVIKNAAGTGAPGIFGEPGNTAGPMGYLGEVVISRVPNTSPVSLVSGTPKNITAITLTPGNWVISGQADVDLGGGTFSNGISQVSLTANTNAPTAARGCPSVAGELQLSNFVVGGAEVTQTIPPYNVNISVTTTFNLVQLMNSTGTLTAQGFIQGLRIR